MKQGYMHSNIKKYIHTILNILLVSVILLLSSSCSKDAVKGEDSFDPEASIAKADELIKEGFFDDAREVLEEIKARDASRQYAMMAKLRIADTYFAEELYDEAAVEYESFLSIHSHHKYASYAQFRLAMTYFKRIGTIDVSASWAKRAISEFEKLQRQYPRNPYMDVTESRIKMCKRILAEYEFYVGSYYFEKESYQAAVSRLNGMLEKYPDSKMEAQALYYLGLSYENLGQRDKALNMLHSLIGKFPTIKLSSDAKELIASFEDNNKD
jgi:outer membrane protein assembly factor BamD